MKQIDKNTLVDWEKYKEDVMRSTPVDQSMSHAERERHRLYLEAHPIEWIKFFYPGYAKYEFADFQKRAIRRILAHDEWYEVLPIADHQCHNWLETEYNTAVLRARQAANWQQFQTEKDILPNLKWLPSTSPNPGADHRPFWNTILPIDHPFWNEHRPGDRWNCKCDLTSTDEPPTTAPSGSPAGNDPQPGLKDNPGKSQAVFSDDHPYYPKDCKHCPFYNPTLQARLSRVFKAQGKKGNCNSCPYVDNAVQTAKAETVPTDIRTHLLQLHELSGAEFSKKLTEIISRKEFKPVEGLKNIFSTGGEKAEDYDNLINGAKKAVAHGYSVYILPNPKGLRTGDYIFVRKNICKLFDLKTISGASSAGNRMQESIGQTNRVLLNMTTTYDPRRLAQEIKAYFEANPEAKEVLIFKGKREISITRDMINKYFVQDFMKEYGK